MAIHYTFTVQFSKIIDNTCNMGQKTYAGDQTIKLFCMNYNVKCLLCKNKRQNQLGNVNVLVCKTCDITWYHGLLEST